MKRNSYSREEVLAAGSKLPERGPICHECGATIPIFEDLPDADERRVRNLIFQNRRFMAMIELRGSDWLLARVGQAVGRA